MAASPRDPTNDPAGTPRWVKLVGAIVVILIVLFVVALLIGGKHGPGRHASAFAGFQSVVTEDAVDAK